MMQMNMHLPYSEIVGQDIRDFEAAHEQGWSLTLQAAALSS